MTKKERAEKIERIIELVYDSLQSHLPYTYESDEEVKGGEEFHKKAIQEYAEIIKLLSELY